MASIYVAGWIGNNEAAPDSASEDGLRGREESSLVAAAQRGESEAFQMLVEPHSQKIFKAILRITKNREDAEDALQNSFLKAFLHIRNFDGRSKFSTWLTRIAINSAFMIVRTKGSTLAARVESHDGQGRPGLDSFPDRAPNPEATYLQRERRALIHRAIDALPPTIRKAVELQRLQELSVKKTADILGLSVAAVKSRLFRARVELRRSLA